MKKKKNSDISIAQVLMFAILLVGGLVHVLYAIDYLQHRLIFGVMLEALIASGHFYLIYVRALMRSNGAIVVKER